MAFSSERGAFMAALAPELRTIYEARTDLDDELVRLVADARAADPDVDATRLAEDIAARCDGHESLSTLRAADLALAAACARGEPKALARFEAQLFGQIDAAYAQLRPATVTLDELRQAMRDRLFVADGAPRIASYRGRGDLRSWVRMAATRFLIDLVRADSARPDRPAGDEQLADVATTAYDPEIAFLKHTYRNEFRAAFSDALAALEPRERNVLRLRYLDGLEVAEVARVYRVHRVSMSRTLAKIRTSLLAAIHETLVKRLDVDRDELDSIMTLIHSQLDVTLGGLLRSSPQ
jgi:RNA polymerase sigma-70 factor (ECF subfamily)